MPEFTDPRRTRRSRLADGVALGAVFAAAAVGAAHAQVTPMGTITGTVVNPGGTAPTVNSGAGVGADVANITAGAGRQQTTVVDLNESRTIIDWATFDLTPEDTLRFNFDARNDVVLNRVAAGSATIDGALQGRVGANFGGNVWFQSTNGVLFGPDARVDVGGLLATTSAADQAAFLDGSNFAFNFTGAASQRVEIQAGAEIRGRGGVLAFIAPEVAMTGGSITATGPDATRADAEVLFGAATDFVITFAQPAGNTDFDMLSFVVPAGGAGGNAGGDPAIRLAGPVTAGEVFIAAVVDPLQAASAVIDITGTVTAVSAASVGGDIVLSGGGGLTRTSAAAEMQSGGIGAGEAVAVNLAQVLDADSDIRLSTSGVLDLTGAGALTAGQDIELTAGDFTGNALNDADLSEGRDLTITDVAGGLTLTGDLTATRNLTVGTTGGTLSLDGVTLTGDTGDVRLAAAVDLVDDVTIDAGQDAVFDNTVDGGEDLEVTAGRDVTFDNLVGGGASLRSLTVDAVGAVRTESVSANRSIRLVGGSVATGALSTGQDVVVHARTGDADVLSATAEDDIFVTAATGDAILRSAVLAADSTGLDDDQSAGAGLGFTDSLLTRQVVVRSQGNGVAQLGADTAAGIGAGNVLDTSAVALPDTGAQVQVRSDGGEARANLDSASRIDLLEGGSVSATVATGDLAFGTVTSDNDAFLSAANGTLSAVTVNVDRDYAVEAQDFSAAILAPAGGVRDLSITDTLGDFVEGDVSADRNLTIVASNGSVEVDNAAAGDGALILTGQNVTVNNSATAGTDVTVTATDAAGVADLADVTATDGSVSVVGQTVTADSLTAGVDVRVAATGGTTIQSASAQDDIFITSAAGAAVLRRAVLTVDGGAAGVDTDGAGGLDQGGALRQLTLRATGGQATLGADSEAGIAGANDFTIAGDAALAQVTSTDGSVAVFLDQIALGGGTLGLTTAGDATLAVQTGDLALGAVGFTGAAGDLNAAALGGDLSFGDLVAPGNVTLSAADALTGTSVLASGGSVDLGAGSIAVSGAVEAGAGSVTAVAGAGAAALGAAVATDDILVRATGGSATLGAATLAATAADLDADGLNVEVIANGGTADAVLGSAGTITAGNSLTLNGLAGVNVRVDASAGRDAIVGLSGAATLTEVRGARDALVRAAGDVAIDTVRADDRNVLIESTGGQVDVVTVAANIDAGIRASQDVTVSSVTATDGSATIESVNGAVDLASVNAGLDIDVTGASIVDTGGFNAGRDLSLAVTAGDLVFTDLGAVRNLSLSASGAVSGDNATATNGSLSLDGNSVSITGTARAGTDVFAQAGAGGLSIGSAEAGDSLNARSAASLSINSAVAGEDVFVQATGGSAAVGAAVAGDDIFVLAAGGNASLGAATLAADADADPTDATVPGLDVGGTTRQLVVRAAGADADAVLGAAGAPTAANFVDATLAGDPLSVEVSSAGRDAIVGLDSATRDGGVPFRFGSIEAARDASAFLATGALAIDSLGAGDDARAATGAGRLEVGTATASAVAGGVDDGAAGSNLELVSAGALTVGMATADNDVALTSNGTLTVTALAQAGDDLTLSAAGFDVVADGADLVAEQTGGLGFAGDGAAGSNVFVTAENLTVRDIRAGNQIVLSIGQDLTFEDVQDCVDGLPTCAAVFDLSVGGDIDGGTVVAGGDLSLNAGGNLTLGSAAAQDDMALTATGTVDVGSASALATDPAAVDGEAPGAAGAGSNLRIEGETLVLGTVRAGSDVRLVAGAPGVTAAEVTAGDDVSIQSSGLADVDALRADSQAAVIAAGGLDDVEGDGSNVSVVATGDVLVGTGVARADLQLQSDRDVSLTTGRAGGDLTVVAGRDATGTSWRALDDLTVSAGTGQVSISAAGAGDEVLLVGASVDAGALTARQGDADVGVADQLSGGGFPAVDGAADNSNIVVRSDGNVTVAAADANGDVTLVAGDRTGVGPLATTANLTVTGSATAGDDVVLRAGGLADIAAAEAIRADHGTASFTDTGPTGSNIEVAAGRIDLGSAEADLDVQLTSTTGDIAATSLRGRDIRVDSAGEADLTTSVADRDLLVQAVDGATLSSATAEDDVRVRSTGGAVTLGTVRAGSGGADPDSEGDGSNLNVLAVGDVRVTSAGADEDIHLVSSGGDARIDTAFAGDDLFLLADAGTARLGNTTLTDDGADLDGDFFGSNRDDAGNGRRLLVRGAEVVVAGTIVTPPGADIDFSSLGDLTLDVDGDLTVSRLSAGDDVRVTVEGGDLTVQSATATGAGTDGEGDGFNVALTADGVTVTDFARAADDVTVRALAGDAFVQRAEAGDDIYVLASAGSARVRGAVLTAASGRDLDSDGGGAASLDTAGNGRTIRVQARGASGDVILGTPGAPTGADELVAPNGATVELLADRDVVVDVTSTGQIDLARAGRDARLTSQGDLNLGVAQALGRDVVLTGLAALDVDQVLAARNATLTSVGALDVGSVEATAGDLLIDSQSTLDIDNAFAGQDATLLSAGALVAGTLETDTGDLLADSEAGLSVDVARAGRDLTLSSAIAMTAGLVDAGRDASLNSDGALTVTTLQAGRDAGLDSAALLTVETSAVAGDDLTLASAAGILAEDLATTGLGADAGNDGANVRATARNVTIGTVDAAGDAIVRATTGDVSIRRVTAGDDAFITAEVGDALVGALALTAAGPNRDSDGAGTLDTAAAPRRAVIRAGRDAQLGAAPGVAPTAQNRLELAAPDATAVTLRAGRDARVALSGPAVLTRVQADRDVLVAAGAVTVRALGTDPTGVVAGRNAVLEATNALNVNTVRAGVSVVGGDARLTGEDVTATGVIAATGNVVVTSTRDQTLAEVDADGSIVLDSGRDVSVSGPLTADVDISVDSGRDQTLARIDAGADVRLTSDGTITVNALLRAGGNVLTDSVGDQQLTSLDVTGAATLLSDAGLAVSGLLAVDGALVTDSAGVQSLAGVQAGDDADLTSGATLTVAGPLTVAGALTTDSAQAQTLAAVDVEGTADLVSRADLTVTGLLDVAGDLTTTSTGAQSLASVQAGANATLTSASTLDVSGPLLVAGALVTDSAQAQTLASADVEGTAQLSSDDSLTATGLLDVTGDLTATTGGDLSLVTVRGGANVTLDSGAALDVSGLMTVAGTLTTDSAGAQTLADVTVGGAADLSSGSTLAVSGLLDVGGDLTTASTGDQTLADVTARAAADLTSEADLSVTGLLDVTGDLTATTGGDLRLASVRGGANVVLDSGAALTVEDDLVVLGTLTTDSVQDQVLADLDVDGAADLASEADLTVTGLLDVAGNLTVDTVGDLSLAAVQAGSDATLTSDAALDVSGLMTVAGTLTTDSAGAQTLADVSVGAGADLSSGSTLAVSGLLDVGGNLTTASAGGQTLAEVDVDGTADLETEVTLTVAGLLRVGLDLTTSSPGLTRLAAVNVGGDATLTSAAGLIVEGELRVVGDLATDSLTQSLAGVDVDGNAVLTSGGILTVSGPLVVDGALTASSVGDQTLASLDIGGPAQLSSDADLTVTEELEADGDLTTASGGDTSLQAVTAGANASLTSGGALDVGGTLQVAGNLVTDSVGQQTLAALDVGGTVTLVSDSGLTAGDLIESDGDLSITTALALQLAALDVGGNASLTSGSTLTVSGSAVTAGALVTASTGAQSLGAVDAGGDVTLDSDATLAVEGQLTADGALVATSAGDQSFGSIETGGNASLESAAGVAITGAGGDGISNVGGDYFVVTGANSTASFGDRLVSAVDGRVRAGDIDIGDQGGLEVAGVLTLESRTGGVALGDDPPADPFGAGEPGTPTGDALTLSDAEFGRIVAPTLDVFAGSTEAGATDPTGNIRLGRLQLVGVEDINLYARADSVVHVGGAVTPGVRGLGRFRVGGETSADGVWTPKAVYVTGSIGAAQAAGDTVLRDDTLQTFDNIELNAGQDIIIGADDRFIGAIDETDPAAINLTRGRPAAGSLAPADLGRVFIASDTLTLRADGKVVQQNTGGAPGRAQGIYLDNADGADTILRIGTTGSGAAAPGEQIPSIVELFLSFRDSGGNLISRQIAAANPGVVLEDGVERSNRLRINGCVIGAAGNCTPLADTILIIEPERLLEGLVLAAQDDEEEDDPTITGAGNEEIWRTPE